MRWWPVRAPVASPRRAWPGCRWLCAASLLAALPAQAWVYPEHRDIAVVGVQALDEKRGAQFQALWLEARAGHETRLCEQAADAKQGVTPLCIDWAAMPAISGDHSCSSSQMLDTVLASEWILGVADVAAQLKVDLSRVPVVPRPGQTAEGSKDDKRLIQFPDLARRLQDEAARAERVNALRSSDIRMQRADPAYATRAGANNAHFLTARPTTTINPMVYGQSTIGVGHELNAIGVYSWFHLSALEKAMQLAREKLSPAQRAALVRAMLADEAFALHFLQDTYAAGHVAGTWGDASQRKGTHDFYNANGLEVRTWDNTDRSVVLMGDAHMRPEDAKLAGQAVRISLEQLLDVVNGRPVPGLLLPSADDIGPDAFDVCKAEVFPARQQGHELAMEVAPVLAETLMPTPVPSLGPGLGSMPRFRSEVGPFVGMAASLDARRVDGGFVPSQDTPGMIYGLDLGLRVGLGLEGVMGDAGDGLVFAQVGFHSDGASTNRAADDGGAAGGGLLAAIPSRSGVSARLRMPFYLIPGDLLFGLPLAFIAPQTYSTMAVTASNGGLIPWQLGMSTSIGRFQFVLGRELGVTFYGATDTDSLVAPGPPPMILDYKSTYYDLPILEYRPYRSFDSNQSSTVLFQLFGGIDVPHGYGPTIDYGLPTPKLNTVYSIGLRLVFDWRYYY